MSIKLMTVAWEMPIPFGQKLVLLALCDNANDQGECYPSIKTLSKKCSMSERSVFSHIDWLEKRNVLHRENRLGRSSIYHIHPCKFCTPENSAPTPAIVSPTPENSAPTPAIVAAPPANFAPITITKPPIESPKEPSENLIAPKKSRASKDKPSNSPLLVEVDKQIISDFLAVRDAKNLPLTETALKGIKREADKLGYTLEQALTTCCERGWAGFKADWILREQAETKVKTPISREQEKRESTERARARVFGANPTEKDITHEATRL